MGKQKKKQSKRRSAAAELRQEEASEELSALSAIFGDDLQQFEGSLGFQVHIVPHPGEARANYVGLTLVVSYPDDYPAEELILKLIPDANGGLDEAAVRKLSKQLHTAAAQFAADSEVCCFQLITAAQEFLQQHNLPPEEEAAPQSLWHEMLERDMAAAAAAATHTREQSYRTLHMGDTFFDSLEAGGLFSDAVELAGAGTGGMHASTAAVPVMEVRSKPAAHKPAAGGPVAAAAEVSLAPAAHTAGASPAAAEEAPAAAAGEDGVPSSTPPPAAPAAAALTALSRLDEPSGLSSANSGSMLKSLGHSIRGALPRALRRYVAGSASPEERSEAAGEAGGAVEADRQLIRQELLTGHLLSLAASTGAVPPHALPSIAGMLQAGGLIPKWLAYTLTQQPALFDRAFQRVFRKELAAAAEEPEGGEGEGEENWFWKQRFWGRRAAPQLAARSVSHRRSRGLLAPADMLPSSRYETDFSELRALGQGGYGVVVAAINRLDGRQYAVKKIPLDAHSAAAYERIMREVTTLSRLQHANVVRYFQAWVEASRPEDEGEGSEGDEWGSGSITPSSSTLGWGLPTAALPGSRPALAGGKMSPGPGSRGHLPPVEEVSREGRASTPSKGHRSQAAGRSGSGTSTSGTETESGTDSESESSSESKESGSGGQGLAAGASTSLSAQGGQSQNDALAPSSRAAGFKSVWYAGSQSDSQSASQSADDQSQSGTLPSAAGLATANGSGDAASSLELSVGGTGSDFTFDRSRPPPRGAGAGGPSLPSATQPSRRSSDSRQRPQRQMLFIQMEFCPRTLRDVLDSRELDEERRWSILRQLLAGLAHIHSQGIIHRDLKPANTFLDSQGNVKLGDFGLAKYNRDSGGEDGLEPSPSLPGGGGQPGVSAGGGGGGGASALLSDTTGLVGTSFYISPEISQGWASYTAKVDCFSLGVMAFELWHPFATAMERAVLLRDLREQGALPPAFEARHPEVCRVIRWLLAPNPADRPTAMEVLRSEMLPPQVLDEQLTDLLRCLPDNPAMHERVLEAVFSLARSDTTTASLAALEAPGAPVAVQMAVRDHVLSVLKECFERHGAVGMCSQEVGLAGGDDPPGAVHLLTPAGARLALRWELRQAFAAWFVQQLAAGGSAAGLLLDGVRRYEVAAVQRHSAGQGLPRSFLQADLDFVQPGDRTAAELLLGDAEVITCVHEALAELPECGEVEVRVGHRALYDLALSFIGVSREARGSVVQLLSTASAASPLHATARSKRWPSIKAGLEGIGLSADAVGRCRQLVLQAAGEGEPALFRLRTMLAHTAANKQQQHGGGGGGGSGHRAGSRPHPGASALSCLDELQQLLQYLQAWGVPSAVLLVDPLLAPHSDAFSGALFQCHLAQGDAGATAVVAAGGRYDSLLRASWARQSALSGSVAATPPLHAAGVTLNVDRLVQVAQASARWRTPGGLAPVAGLPRLSQADVLVCSRGGGGLLRERMALARSLWDAGLAAEMLPQAAPSLTEQYEYAQSRGIAWLVIINASTFEAADTVRVKSMNARLEEDVSVSELPTYLLSALNPHGGAATAASARMHTQGSRPPGDDGEGLGEPEEAHAHGWRQRRRR